MPLRLAILTVSDAGSRGERADSSGDLIATWAKERRYTITERALVPDETGRIAAILAEWSDGNRADLILTTGGTGLTARDVTPEATRAILDKEAPGIAEALRMSVFPRFPRAALSRGLAGGRAATTRSTRRRTIRSSETAKCRTDTATCSNRFRLDMFFERATGDSCRAVACPRCCRNVPWCGRLNPTASPSPGFQLS